MKKTVSIFLMVLLFGISFGCKAPKGTCDAYTNNAKTSKSESKDPIYNLESENSNLDRNTVEK